jgi:penicillin amidase
MNSIQNDIVAINDKRLGDYLVRAAENVKPRDARTSEIISRLGHWDGSATADSVEASFVEVTRDALLKNVLDTYLVGASSNYQWRGSVFLERILQERPPKWLPPPFHSYDELLIGSADEAVAVLDANTRSKDISAWQMGKLNALEMNHPLGSAGILHRFLSIGPLEQSGSPYSPKALTQTHGPAMRFVADLSDWDQSLMEINSGESGEFGSVHYKDQFRAWFDGRGIKSVFSSTAEDKTRANHLMLVPAGAR